MFSCCQQQRIVHPPCICIWSISKHWGIAALVCCVLLLDRASEVTGILTLLICLCRTQTLCPTLPNGARIVLNCSGRGDKDVNTAIKALGM